MSLVDSKDRAILDENVFVIFAGTRNCPVLGPGFWDLDFMGGLGDL